MNEEDDPRNRRVFEALRALNDEHTPPPGWEERVLERLTRWGRIKAWFRRLLRR